ncbi:MAG: lytic transglycosylase domain-containing protein [bacterium]|jgi:soluble lytic murein transglycosylase|nr:lytic transglycosylase domain-containing protein [Bacillota bacterium]HHW55929.1 lytic transglycosylase domain-containing protein [Bacillota bacterium]
MIINLRRLKRLIPYLLLAVFMVLFLSHTGWLWRLLYPIHYQEIIFRCGREFGVDPFLITAVIRVESKYYPRALSPAGAVGLMQIMPETGQWVAEKLELENFTPDLLYEPEINIRIGTWYLASLQEEFGDLNLVLAAYNGGRGNVKRWLEKQRAEGQAAGLEGFPFPETRSYVVKVLHNYKRYREIYQK